MAITFTSGSEAIGVTEHFLHSDSTTATYVTTDTVVQLYLDLDDMVAGDELEIKFYEKIDGTNARVVYQANLVGAQPGNSWVSPAFAMSNWEISADTIAGTSITVEWEIAKIT